MQLRGLGVRGTAGTTALGVGVPPMPLLAPATAARPLPSVSGATWLASGDVDGDGDTDLVTRVVDGPARGQLVVLRNDGGSRQASLRVRLDGKVSNRSAVGSKVELRAGSLRQKLETASAWPAAAPSDLLFGLGARPSADVVRVIWPAGIVQAELAPAAGRCRCAGCRAWCRRACAGPAAAGHGTMTFTELDRKPSSCPYLFTWNGERFEFITDFMGGGEMGYLHAPGVVGHPDPEEYTRIDGDPAGAARRPLRAARHQRARGDAVPRSGAADRGRPSGDGARSIRAKAPSRRRSRRSGSMPRPAPGRSRGPATTPAAT